MSDSEQTPFQPSFGSFPDVRMRRRRRTPFLRSMVREHALRVDHLVWPVFVQDQPGTTEVTSMPGVLRFGPDVLVDAVGEAQSLGIPAIALFPETPEDRKTPQCEEAWNPDNLVCRSLRTVRDAGIEIGLITDVALDPYNSDGHDGLVRDGKILNDETLECLVRQAICQAEAGADVQAPSDMMDGRIGVLRQALDEAGHQEQCLLSYAAKYASAFYGPFRDAVGSAGRLKGDKRTYQMDPANLQEALQEAELDLAEGADFLMVKPGLPYLDVLHMLSREVSAPLAVYQVSGEYAMLRTAAAQGVLELDACMLESLTAFVRAGASMIFTYFAPDAARALRGA
ncbi:MAG: porphobilinogen synthase [Planctomycetota bacterium]